VIAGVDGHRRGWVVAIEEEQGRTRLDFETFFATLVDRAELDLIVVDIPIGLLRDRARQCDLLARRLLGRGRGSSVFPAPYRSMLAAEDWAEACRLRTVVDGKRCTKQVAAILAKIREVDGVLSPALQARVFEAHPEVIFTLMNATPSGRHALPPKKQPPGRDARLRLLRQSFPDLDERLRAFRRDAVTDAIDAYACLWTARRIASFKVVRMPETPEMDERGLRAEILA
jgi:predicted RNase H-like nuclease